MTKQMLNALLLLLKKTTKELPLWKADSQALRQLKVACKQKRNTRVKMKSILKQQQSDYSLMKSIGMDKKDNETQ
ncbi:MAG: hypothetical protein U0T32_01460 [Chitinophagales bacterium]